MTSEPPVKTVLSNSAVLVASGEITRWSMLLMGLGALTTFTASVCLGKAFENLNAVLGMI
jgi:hypothetical protein